jgi:hypothetical protein
MITKEHLMDVRVRERYLKRGMVNPKEVEKMLAELPDLASEIQEVGLAQPALGDEDDFIKD